MKFTATFLCAFLMTVKLLAVTTLADYMVAQLASRTNGTACGGVGLVNATNGFSSSPTLNTNYWLLGVTNITAESATSANSDNVWGAGYLTAVSPRHCVYAAHIGCRTTNVWILPNGSLYTNWVIATSNSTALADIGVALMANTNPFFAKIFPNATNYIGCWQSYFINGSNGITAPGTGTIPLFVRNHRGSGSMWYYGYTATNQWYEPNFVSGISAAFGTYAAFVAESELQFGDYLESGSGSAPTTWPTGDQWISGDSGGPAYAIINNEAVLVGPAYSGLLATPIASYETIVDNCMAALSTANSAPVYSTTSYNLSAFPLVNYNNIPLNQWAPAR